MQAVALANTNIALIKYWGKKNTHFNIPAVGSISITLGELFTKTKVSFLPELKFDSFILNGKKVEGYQTNRISKFLDLIREKTKLDRKVEIISDNNFPTEAGLASSASGFAALTLAATKATNLNLSKQELSILARIGSGSAARSIFGGFVEMKVGDKENGSDSFAVPIADKNYWPLNLLILITSEEKKQVGSTNGMNLSAETSPYYKEWINSSQNDIVEMHNAITEKDFEKLGVLSEHNCLKMHGLALSANPGLLYWNGVTVDAIHAVRELRKNNIQAYFTIDAGPQVKVICETNDVQNIKKNLENINGVKNIIHTSLGSDAKIIREEGN